MFKHQLYFDTETYSELDLRKVGTAVYAANAEIIMAQYALDDGEPVAITTGWAELTNRRHMNELAEYLRDPQVQVVIHNSTFDLAVLRHAWNLEIPRERVYDTMVQALAHGLPGGLDKLSTLLDLPPELAKQAEMGKAGMHLFCRPRPKNQKLRRATPFTHPREWADFCNYGLSDILAMREAYRKVPQWNYRKDGTGDGAALWRLDARINDRGIQIDTEMVGAMILALRQEKEDQRAQTAELTVGIVDSMQQRDELLKHILDSYGVSLPDMRADTLRRRLEDETLPDGVRELLELRLVSNKSSTAKYQRLSDAVSDDGRLRNTLQVFGAQRTGRWAGRVFQPHNLPRPDLKNGVIEAGIEFAVSAAKAGSSVAQDIELVTGVGATRIASNALRGTVIAAPGRKLVVSDWANIEGRISATVAGEDWKVEAFREFDALVGEDLYKLAYARSFGVPVSSVKDDSTERQMGKVQVLSLQYQGGSNAYASMAAVYRINLEDLAAAVREVATPEAWKHAEGFVAWMKSKKKPLPGGDEVSTACEVLKTAWREAHPAHVEMWRQLDAAWRMAVRNPGEVFTAGKDDLLQFHVLKDWLRIKLPSGRLLCYRSPRVDESGFRFMGLSPYSRQWGWVRTFAGKLHENLVQGIAADVLAHALPRVDPVMPVVLHVHDEIITEVEDVPEFTAERLSQMMCEPLPWLPQLPLAAKGFETYRYRKG